MWRVTDVTCHRCDVSRVSYICAVTHPYVKSIVHMCRDSSTCEVTLSLYLTIVGALKTFQDVPRTTEQCLVRMCSASYVRAVPRTYVQCLINMGVTRRYVKQRIHMINDSPIWAMTHPYAKWLIHWQQWVFWIHFKMYSEHLYVYICIYIYTYIHTYIYIYMTCTCVCVCVTCRVHTFCDSSICDVTDPYAKGLIH